MASQDQGSHPPPSDPQSDIVNGDTTNPQPSSHTADDLSSSLAPGNPTVNGAVNGDTTNPQPASHATGGLPLNMAQGNPTGNGPITTWNQFDQALLTGQQREDALQNPEMANFLAALSRALPSSPAYYAGDDGLQAYLIRQQLCAGIPLDQIEPMNGPGARRRTRMETRGPVLIEVSDQGANVPMIPPARFNGILYPLPLHPWLPNPEDYPQAQATSGTGENAANNTESDQSQGTVAINDREEQDDLAEPLASGDDEDETETESSQEDTESEQSGSNTALANHPQGMGPANDHTYQPASQNGNQLDGDIDMMGSGLAGNHGVLQVENMAHPMLNSRHPFNAQPMMGTNAHIGNTQPMIGNNAYLGNVQPMMGNNPPNHAQSDWMNNSSINHEYAQPMTGINQATTFQDPNHITHGYAQPMTGINQANGFQDSNHINHAYVQPMTGINQANGFQDPNHITHGSNPSLWAFNNQPSTDYVSQGPFPAMAGNSMNNPFQTFGANNQGTNGFPQNNGTTNPYASYQPMLGNNQAGAAPFNHGVTDRNVQYTMPDAVRSMADYFNRIPLPPRPNDPSGVNNTSNELAIFFDTEEEQRAVTNFYVNHFSGPHGA